MQSGHNKHKNEVSNSYPSVDSNHNYNWRLTTVNILLQKQMTREQNPFMWVIVSFMWVIVSFMWVIVSFMWVIVSGAQAVSVTRAFTEWWSFYHQKQQHDLDFNGRFPGAHSNPRKGPQQRTCQFPVSPPPPPCGTEPLALVEQVSTGWWTPVLSHNHQCQNTQGKKKHWSQAWKITPGLSVSSSDMDFWGKGCCSLYTGSAPLLDVNTSQERLYY